MQWNEEDSISDRAGSVEFAATTFLRGHNFDEAPCAKLSEAGLSAEYVTRETRRVVQAVRGRIAVYPGIDVGVPCRGKQVTPADVRDAVKGAFAGGAQGVVLSRKYSEMKLANLAGAAVGLREAGML